MKQIALNIMEKTISVNGMAVVTVNDDNRVKNIQFLPDDELALVLEQGSTTNGQLQLLRNASFDYVANKPRQRANSTLLRKAAHGRLSATKDEAYQLTLKIFKREGLDVKETLMREAMELINNVRF
jgi:hypothetical protein